MSVIKAINLIRTELPEEVAVAIQHAVETSVTVDEVTLPGFSAWHMKSPENFKFICERRLIGCETEALAQWLRQQLDFVDESFAASSDKSLWQAYSVGEAGRRSFLVDTTRSCFCVGPFP